MSSGRILFSWVSFLCSYQNRGKPVRGEQVNYNKSDRSQEFLSCLNIATFPAHSPLIFFESSSCFLTALANNYADAVPRVGSRNKIGHLVPGLR